MLASEWTEYDFKLCTSADDLRAAYNLRLEVFHEEQKFPKETEVDSYDPISAHFIVISKNDNKVVATIRLSPYPSSNQLSNTENFALSTEQLENFPLGNVRLETEIINEFLRVLGPQEVIETECIRRSVKLGRMAVKETMRGKGIGAMTLRGAENWLLWSLCGNMNLQEITLVISSQMQAKMFYEKIGYVSQGEPYDEEGMQHILCRKQIGN